MGTVLIALSNLVAKLSGDPLACFGGLLLLGFVAFTFGEVEEATGPDTS